MGCFDLCCPLCGNSCHSYDEYPGTNWLDKCTFLTTFDDVVHGCQETACNTVFEDRQRNEYDVDDPKHDTHMLSYHGIFVHTACWMFVKRYYKINLCLSMLPVKTIDWNLNKVFPHVNYGSIELYWEQDFDFERAVKDKKGYIFKNPLTDTKNAVRVRKIISQLKLRPGRKGPCVSATLYPKGTVKLGGDGNFWTVSKGKWIKLPDKVVTLIVDAKDMKQPWKIPHAALYGQRPLFVKKFDKKTKKLVVVCSPHYASILSVK